MSQQPLYNFPKYLLKSNKDVVFLCNDNGRSYYLTYNTLFREHKIHSIIRGDVYQIPIWELQQYYDQYPNYHQAYQEAQKYLVLI